jgi:hypothetical protein
MCWSITPASRRCFAARAVGKLRDSTFAVNLKGLFRFAVLAAAHGSAWAAARS